MARLFLDERNLRDSGVSEQNIRTVRELTEFANAQADIAAAQTDITAVEADITTLQGDVTAAQAAADAAQADADTANDTTAEAERIRDVIGTALVAGSNVTITVNDGADTITIASTGGGGSSGERTRTIPEIADFTLENANSATATDTAYGINLAIGSGLGSHIRFIRQTTAPPAAPYTMIVRAAPISGVTSANIYQRCLIARNSSNGRLIIAGDYNDTATHLVQRWSDYSSFSANGLAPAALNMILHLPWMRFQNDGTNIIYGRSPDGESWIDYHTEPLATYLTAAGGTVDQIGFGTWTNNIASQALFQSFEVA